MCVVGAILVAQWMLPCHCPGASNISKQLDSIAEVVAVELLKADENGEGDKTGSGASDPKRPRQSPLVEVTQRGLSPDAILAALNTVLYDKLGFKGAPSDSYYELDNSYINKVSS